MVGLPLAPLTKVLPRLHQHPKHVGVQLDFQNAFGTMHRKACMDQFEKHTETQAPWMVATKKFLELGGSYPKLSRRHGLRNL